MDAELSALLLRHCRKYPRIQIQDAVKLIFQNEFGGGHAVSSAAESLKRLAAECAGLGAGIDQEAFEDIGNGLCRLNLTAVSRLGLELSTVNMFFVATANSRAGTMESFIHKLETLKECCRSGKLPFSLGEVENYLREYQNQGCPPVSHSQEYRTAYSPSYRVVDAVCRDFLAVFVSIDKLLKQHNSVCIAIDGNSAAGKTSLAALIQRVYDANVFHMDDFFLPLALKTQERLRQPGGNVHYERFQEEVISGLQSGGAFEYRPFSCSRQELGEAVPVQPRRVNVVEGAYSMHPSLIDHYHLKVFLAITPQEQSRRILKRNGPAMHKRFLDEWIPLENKYFAELRIKEQSDLILHQD